MIVKRRSGLKHIWYIRWYKVALTHSQTMSVDAARHLFRSLPYRWTLAACPRSFISRSIYTGVYWIVKLYLYHISIAIQISLQNRTDHIKQNTPTVNKTDSLCRVSFIWHLNNYCTWVCVSPSVAASSARSGSARYCVRWKRRLSCCSWRLE